MCGGEESGEASLRFSCFKGAFLREDEELLLEETLLGDNNSVDAAATLVASLWDNCELWGCSVGSLEGGGGLCLA